jgi:hypothetical protein
MCPAGFEPAIPANEQPQTDALGRTNTMIGISKITGYKNKKFCK